MSLTLLGRLIFGALAVVTLSLFVSSFRRGDSFGMIVYAGMVLMFGLPALFGRDSLTAYSAPVPRPLRWLFKTLPPG